MPFATHILLPTDFSEAAGLAAKAAALLAEELGAKITAMHVQDPSARRPSTIFSPGARPAEMDRELAEVAKSKLEEMRDGVLSKVSSLDLVVVRDESPANAITTHAEKVGADLIVIATHGRTGLKQLLIGSVAERVVRHASMPVLTLRTDAAD